MPMQRDRYPKDWDQIARRIKRSANWHCEACDRPCLLPGENWADFVIRMSWTVAEAIAHAAHPVQFVLTTAHPNHDPENPDAELKAWCASCHARYDLRQMGRKQMLKRERTGQLNLFDLTAPGPAGHGKDASRIQLPLREVT